MTEAILDPELPIIDAHHHLWDLRAVALALKASDDPYARVIENAPLYLLEQLQMDATRGHRVVATVYLECGAFYRTDGPRAMKPVGEIEFATMIAERCIAETGGALKACAGIVGHADLTLGDEVVAVLEAEVAAGAGRLKGIRHAAAYDADPKVFGMLNRAAPDLLSSQAFRAGYAHLHRLGLTFDAWIGDPQLPELLSLARAYPETGIVLDHVGTPLGIGSYAGRLAERFAPWRAAINDLSQCPNVSVKLGGLGMPYSGLVDFAKGQTSSEILAACWKPYFEVCIEAFGADRAMFESNFPVDRQACDYATLWNAFKRSVVGASNDEKNDLFSGTASRVYRLF